MDIYLTDNSNKKIQIPCLPVSLSASFGSTFLDYDILELGNISIPHGQDLTTIQWDGLLPGKPRQNESWVKSKIEPVTFEKTIRNWQKKGSKLRLLITETIINIDVYIDKFDSNVADGSAYGDHTYTIALKEAKELLVKTEKELGYLKVTPKTTTRSPSKKSAFPKTYKVVKGDSLWKIAKKFYGAGSKWNKIYNANKKVIGKNPNLIYPNQKLKIPK